MPRGTIIQVFGAPGAGVSSVAEVLANVFAINVVDTDKAHWENTDPPYQRTRSLKGKREAFFAELPSSGPSVVAGDLSSWAPDAVSSIVAVIYLSCNPSDRVARIREREQRRFGRKIEEGGEMYERHMAFLQWAFEYESRNESEDRSLQMDLNWLEKISAPSIRISSDHLPFWKVCCNSIQFVGGVLHANVAG